MIAIAVLRLHGRSMGASMLRGTHSEFVSDSQSVERHSTATTAAKIASRRQPVRRLGIRLNMALEGNVASVPTIVVIEFRVEADRHRIRVSDNTAAGHVGRESSPVAATQPSVRCAAPNASEFHVGDVYVELRVV